ncbi:MAG: amidohydrolase [Anaerolineaceae bacterium]|nr:amidohydrolase [Anaerolineaceae bacterium]
MKTKQDILQWLDDNQVRFTKISDKIWENPEIALKEFKSSRLQADFLETEGFRITWDLGGLNTAFVAEWGTSSPIIGFLGEYDALLNLSQKNIPRKEPIIEGGLGQGCGHNLLGVGGMASAVVIKEWLEASGTTGTVRYYGCPAEESGDGKVYMARAGIFDDLNAAFNFHPGAYNMASKASSVGVRDVKFRFYGTSAHAGGSPHLGRSALDAVELMNVGVNYLREHVTEKVRIHYTITHGGDLPNVVPAYAEVWYFIRAQYNDEIEAVSQRVRNIAQGAALMTETRVEESFQGACSRVLGNHYLADLQYEAMKMIGPIEFTEDEIAFAQEINDAYPEKNVKSFFQKMRELQIPEDFREIIDALEGHPLISVNLPPMDEKEVRTGSTDVGDVSQVTPISELRTTCSTTGSAGHSWGIVATSGMSIGHKGMMHAAKIMALAAVDCYTDPIHLEKARAEFEKATKERPYNCPIPEHVQTRIYPNPERPEV